MTKRFIASNMLEVEKWKIKVKEAKMPTMLFLSVQCYAWTEYKFTCVCVCVRVCVCVCGCLSVHHTFCQLALQVRPLNGFLQLIA